MVDLEVGERGDGARERRRVGGGHGEHPGWAHERVQAVEERAGVVEVLDDLAGDDDVGRREAEGSHGVGVATVDDVRLVAALARGGDDPAASTSRPTSSRATPARCAWEPRAGPRCSRLAAGVDEAHVHDALSGAELGQVGETVDEECRRQPVHHVELGVFVIGAHRGV